MMKSLLLVSIFCFVGISRGVFGDGFDSVTAPVVPNISSIVIKQTGQIVYDLSTNTFRGFDSLGNWDAITPGLSLSTLGSGGAAYRLESAELTVGTSCAVSNASSSWITATGATCTVTGISTFVIPTATFTSGGSAVAPNCNCTVQSASNIPWVCTILPSSSSLYVEIRNGQNGYTPGSTILAWVMCQGPKN